MMFSYPRNNRSSPRRYRWAIWFWLAFPLAGLLCACQLSQTAELTQAQTDNIRLTKALHAHLNHGDWQAVESLCAETIRYRGRANHFADVDESKAQFLARYRNMLTNAKPGALEIRQLYPAGAYHVIVEGIASGGSPDTTLPVCLIYTIENNRITRLYAY
jgi:hypothetical protein